MKDGLHSWIVKVEMIKPKDEEKEEEKKVEEEKKEQPAALNPFNEEQFDDFGGQPVN